MESLRAKLKNSRKQGNKDHQEGSAVDMSTQSSVDNIAHVNSCVVAGHSRNSFQEGRINYYAQMNNKPANTSLSIQPVVVGNDLLSSSGSLDQEFLSQKEPAENLEKSEKNKTKFSFSWGACLGCTSKDTKPKIDASDLCEDDSPAAL
jgi:hypothetical protein